MVQEPGASIVTTAWATEQFPDAPYDTGRPEVATAARANGGVPASTSGSDWPHSASA